MKPLQWLGEFQFWIGRGQRHEQARHHARRASEALGTRHYGVALFELVATLVTSPRMARDRLIYGWLAEKALRVFERIALTKR